MSNQIDIAQNFLDYLDRQLVNTGERIASLAEKLADKNADALSALEWAQGAFEDAAKQRVLCDAIRIVKATEENGKNPVEAVQKYAIRKLALAARSGQSTSSCYDLSEKCQQKAWADLIDHIEYL